METNKQITVTTYEPLHNINEGSEFLDDQIRSKDQPLMTLRKVLQSDALRNSCSASTNL